MKRRTERKARIVKKLSKKFVETGHKVFKGAFKCPMAIDEAEEQNTRVKNCYFLGGGLDYWGEGQDAYTAYDEAKRWWSWVGNFPTYPEGHEHEHYPDTGNFKPTTRNLLNLYRELALQG